MLLQIFLVVPLTLTQAVTLYEYYTGVGITEGLSVANPYFTLNGKNITLHSGAMHYFRIPRQYWRDRLKKARAAGLNAVETYIAWNLHEPKNGVFDFGDGGSDFQEFLDIREYLKIAQEEDLFVILRPGPYICAEFEWGGYPSWLLREEKLETRVNNEKYMKYVRRYYNILLGLLLADFQFTRGGPIIAFQVENEYGYNSVQDKDYLQALVDIYNENDIVEILVTSDGAQSGTQGSLPGVLFQTINMGSDPKGNLDQLKQFQPDKPLMVMEYWPGWFDSYGNGGHETVTPEAFKEIYEGILSYPASVNIYMFHGGTNFAFLNGASGGDDFKPITTSYDYDAPLTENGNYTDKYEIIREILTKYNDELGIDMPDKPELTPCTAYASIKIDRQVVYDELVDQALFGQMSNEPLPMEYLSVNDNTGQSYGFIVYRQENLVLPAGAVLEIQGKIYDSVVVMLNGKRISPEISSSTDLDGFGFWRLENSSIVLTDEDLEDAILDLLVENWGRPDSGHVEHGHKGLRSQNIITISGDGVNITHWINIPLEFKRSWNEEFFGWVSVESADDLVPGPALYHAVLTIDGDPHDSYINMENWSMGVVIVNGFVLGRHFKIGPQQALYLPAPFLKRGDNDIIIFELYTPKYEIEFSDKQIYVSL